MDVSLIFIQISELATFFLKHPLLQAETVFTEVY